MTKLIKIKKHLLSDSDREKVFENTEYQAYQYKIYRRYFYLLPPVFIISFFFLINTQNNYLNILGVVLLFLAAVLIRLGSAARYGFLEKKRWETFDRYGNQDFLFIELSVQKSFIYLSDDHLGPFWLGYCGQEEGLLLRGRNLLGFSSALKKSKVQVIVEHSGEIVEVQGTGPRTPMVVLKSKSTADAMERLIIKNGLPDSLVLKRRRFHWLKTELLKEINEF
jgi:hypothetical protein